MFGKLWDNSYIYQFITNNHVSFHLWWKKNLLHYQKVAKCYEHDCRLGFLITKLHDVAFSEFWCTTWIYAAVPQVILAVSANMLNSATSQFIQRDRFSNDSFTTSSFQIFYSRRRSSGILVSLFNPLFHNFWINNFIFTMTGPMRSKGSKTERQDLVLMLWTWSYPL